MKLTDFVADFLAQQNIKHVFGLTGGAVVHLFDSLDRHPDITPIFNHHEQAASFAAEAYARVTRNLGAAIVTTGPGGTNAVTGVCAAWLDSIPCLYISGQTRIEHTSRGKGIRQLGTQEFDIVRLVEPITKYAVMLEEARMIMYHLQKAVHIARSGRPGPVWIDIPLNLEWADVDPLSMPQFYPESPTVDYSALDALIEETMEMIRHSRRPLVVAGYGITLAGAVEEFQQWIECLGIPFVSSWNACDLLPTDHPLSVGRLGIAGQRGANLAVQNTDCLLAIGSHLCIPQTGTNFSAFARGAKKIVVDIDAGELQFLKSRIDLGIQADARIFLQRSIKVASPQDVDIQDWRNRCDQYKKYNAVNPHADSLEGCVNPYAFVDALSDRLNSEDVIVVDGGGTNVYIAFQAFKIKRGQKMILSSGLCAMGSGLPESIGACFASNGKRTICLCGDGSLQLNIQELQTIIHHRLPVKIFVFNNQGYLSIRGTQDGFLKSHYIGSGADGGVSLPDFLKIAQAYGIKTFRLDSSAKMNDAIQQALLYDGPVLCEVMVSKTQEVTPRLGFDTRADGTFAPRPLEDMYPYLDRKEFKENMIVELWSQEGH